MNVQDDSLRGYGSLLCINGSKHELQRQACAGCDQYHWQFARHAGAIYLAYDLLGAEHGPLRTLTRGITYGVLFGAGYGLVLGPIFGLASGAAHGITLAWEFSRASRHRPKPGFWYDLTMSAIRGSGFGLGTAFLFGGRFGIAFGTLSTVGQVIAYRAGIRPEIDYAPAIRPRLTKRQLLAAVNRTAGYAFAGYVSALAGDQRARARGRWGWKPAY